MQEQGIKVIPTVRWGDLASFNFCFDGIEKGSIVAVSTVGVKKQKSLFMLGYNEMLSRIKPSKIICYGKPFDEMKGDVIEVDYAKTNNLTKAYSDVYIKTFYGYVERPTARKGVGSTDGQSAGNPEHTRLPIKAEPNSVRTLYHNGIKIRDRYYDEDGYAKKGYRLY